MGWQSTLRTLKGISRCWTVMDRGWVCAFVYFDFSGSASDFVQTPMQARTEAAIKHVKNEQAKIKMQQLAFEAGLLDPELVFRSIGFTNFLSTWLIRQADPRKAHPNPTVEYVLNSRPPRFSWLMIDSQATSSQGSTYVFQSAPRIHRGGHRRLSLLRCAVSDQ